MKKGIHPAYVTATVRCSCGNTFETRATKPELRVELCNACHPFYTGQQKYVDTGGRVQRFADKYGSAANAVAQREAAKKAERAAEKEAVEAAAHAAREEKAAKKAEKAARYADRISREKEKVAKAAKAASAASVAAASPLDLATETSVTVDDKASTDTASEGSVE